MDAQQWNGLIQELRDAITNAKDTQVRLTTNSTEYTNTISNGFKLIQNTIHDIDGLIEQLTNLIAGLNRQIPDFEAKQSADPTPRLTAEIDKLQTQLSDAQAIQGDAVKAMQESIVALNANNEAMNTSVKSQDVAGLNNTITTTKTNLEEIKTRLQSLLNKPTSMDPQNNPLPDDTEFELPDSDENITYGDLKLAVNNKIQQITREYGKDMVSKIYKDFYNTINAVNADADSIQNALDNMPFINGQLQGGKRKKHKTYKKQRKARRNKTMNPRMNQKMKRQKGYRYTLKSRRKIFNKSQKKRSITRS
jgi:regulator of replication initiation timing